MKSLDLNPYFYSYRDGGSSQDSLWVPKGFERSILVKYTVLAMVLPQLFSDDFSSFSSTISASLSKQTILFHLYNLPSSNYSFAIAKLSAYNCCYSTEAFYIRSLNRDGWSVQHRNDQTTGNSRTCRPAAEDEIKCQCSAEGCVSKFFMGPAFKKIGDPLLPVFN